MSLGKRVARVIGVNKLRAKYKSFESRRQLRDEHDVFLADKRIITMLPKALGKVFYSSGSKRPVPVELEGYKPRKDQGSGRFSVVKKKPGKVEEALTASPAQCAKEIERTLDCALVNLSQAATISIKVGVSNFTPQQVSDNIDAVVNGMVDKHIAKGWRNVKAIHIKGPNTMALPIWLAGELWLDQADILEDDEAERVKLLSLQKGKKRKQRELIQANENEEVSGKKRKAEDMEFSQEIKERREKLRAQKRQMKEAGNDSMSRLQKAPVEGKPKIKGSKKRKVAPNE